MNIINESLMLMVVGMGTVFIVLMLIIFCSKGLIAVINRWFPEKIPVNIQKSTEISAKTIATIVAAVSVVTENRAKVTKIERRNG